ncbi:SDR family NAD(P)-dependent oxidoreductase [Flavobacterium panacagri]|uniref:SDR family NAD(P)-dependent oxidoreductase n=1 Tax=Flavobacterium panacagri TaxID=3034146 RepID=UPI0025A51589|nr:SDR family NAD(P)-dependent oxidoreductase [Flavobacterium panacagri]
MAKTVFITGASRGFGKLWTEALLQKGYNVAATARNISSLDELADKYNGKILPLELDVTDRNSVFKTVERVKEHFGSIDILINNAGYGLFGTLEENTEEEVRQQMETNFFGLVWVTQAVVPIMREQGRGHIIQLSSALGLISFPTLGVYSASKFAVEGLSESLAAEVKGFGIKVTIVEPNEFSTEWGGASAKSSSALPVYENVRTEFFALLSDDLVGIPEATVPAVLKLIESKNPPLRLFLGKAGFPMVKYAYENRFSEWESWSEIANAAHGK